MTFDEQRMELAKRIAKHQAPAQVKIDPDAARRQLVRLAAEKLLDATMEPDFWILDIWECAMLRAMGVKPDF